jgi:hypothetical protein
LGQFVAQSRVSGGGSPVALARDLRALVVVVLFSI